MRKFFIENKNRIQQQPTVKLGLDEAAAKGWTIVSMKDDWKTIFPPEKK